MSSKSPDKKSLKSPGKDFTFESPLNFRNIVIEFSDFGKSEKYNYIYFGNEKIPFSKRDPTYQAIIRNEFAGVVREFLDDLSE